MTFHSIAPDPDSCVILYRDEQRNMLPRDVRANSQTKLDPVAASKAPYQPF